MNRIFNEVSSSYINLPATGEISHLRRISQVEHLLSYLFSNFRNQFRVWYQIIASQFVLSQCCQYNDSNYRWIDKAIYDAFDPLTLRISSRLKACSTYIGGKYYRRLPCCENWSLCDANFELRAQSQKKPKSFLLSFSHTACTSSQGQHCQEGFSQSDKYIIVALFPHKQRQIWNKRVTQREMANDSTTGEVTLAILGAPKVGKSGK